MDLGLKGRVGIIGGGSRGLGKACALSLAREGAHVAICSRGAENLEAAAQEIRSTTDVEVLAVPGDLSRLADIQNLIQQQLGKELQVQDSLGGQQSPRAQCTVDVASALVHPGSAGRCRCFLERLAVLGRKQVIVLGGHHQERSTQRAYDCGQIHVDDVADEGLQEAGPPAAQRYCRSWPCSSGPGGPS